MPAETETPFPSQTRPPFQSMRKASEVAHRFNTWMDEPLVKMFGKGMYFAAAAIVAALFYAGVTKFHEEVAKDPAVVAAAARAAIAEQKADALAAQSAAHASQINNLQSTNEKITGALDRITSTAHEIQVSVATVIQRQEDGQRETRQNIHRIDDTLNAIAARK